LIKNISQGSVVTHGELEYRRRVLRMLLTLLQMSADNQCVRHSRSIDGIKQTRLLDKQVPRDATRQRRDVLIDDMRVNSLEQ